MQHRCKKGVVPREVRKCLALRVRSSGLVYAAKGDWSSLRAQWIRGPIWLPGPWAGTDSTPRVTKAQAHIVRRDLVGTTAIDRFYWCPVVGPTYQIWANIDIKAEDGNLTLRTRVDENGVAQL